MRDNLCLFFRAYLTNAKSPRKIFRTVHLLIDYDATLPFPST